MVLVAELFVPPARKILVSWLSLAVLAGALVAAGLAVAGPGGRHVLHADHERQPDRGVG